MCSYNKINGVYSCQNKVELGHLRQMGFDGFIMSDWGATHSVHDIEDGLDQDMHFDHDFWDNKSLKTLDPHLIDQAVYRILKSMIVTGVMDDKTRGNITANVTSKKHKDIALKVNE